MERHRLISVRRRASLPQYPLAHRSALNAPQGPLLRWHAVITPASEGTRRATTTAAVVTAWIQRKPPLFTMSLNFAPYSSPPSSPRASTSRLPPSSSSTSRPKAKAPWFGGGSYSYQSGSRPADASSAGAGATGFGSSGDGYGYESAPSGDVLWDAEAGAAPQAARSSSGAGPSAGHDAYETTYGWRVDIEAGAAYVLGPVLGIILLMLEHKNDYVCVYGHTLTCCLRRLNAHCKIQALPRVAVPPPRLLPGDPTYPLPVVEVLLVDHLPRRHCDIWAIDVS